MATLQSTSTRLACWRTFNQGSLGTLVAAAEIDVAAGGSTSYLHAQGAFNAELRKPQIPTTPLTPVLAAGARPGHTVPPPRRRCSTFCADVCRTVLAARAAWHAVCT